jgi:very-short-patch-repair endonuclease
MFAAAIEQAGLFPLIAFTKGHAFCGAWLQPQTLEALTCEEPMDLRKAIALNELVLFETTLATGSQLTPFNKAIEDANRRLAEDQEQNFIYAIDIKQARGRQITPLPALGAPSTEPVNGGTGAIPALDPTPDLPGFDMGIEVRSPSDGPESRLEHWRRKLLDLTKRNRLLNLKPSSTAIAIFCPNIVALEDRLAAGKKLTIVHAPRRAAAPDQRDAELFSLRTGDDLARNIAADALERDQIIAAVPEKDLENGLLQLYRKARTDIQEGGSNTLFLALGMLRWRPTGEAERSFKAPLLLIPVKLERRSAASKVRLEQHEDDVVFNLTLLQMLRQDFGVSIPELAGALPRDSSGVDVAQIWEIVRRRVRDIPGFEVVEDVMLSTFSFAKYLMWKDLTDRLDALKKNAFVRHLVETPREAYRHSSTFVAPAETDDRIKPSELFMPLNADSSQVVAVHASGQAGDFVLEGPPGTGKSETIGNIIAHNLALGRRVLFVSEKMAALEVVYRRLRDKGLGDFCLELHSNRANKRDVINQLGHSWTARQKKSSAQWTEQADKLGQLRDELNGLVRARHRPASTGVSPRQAIGRVVRYGGIHSVELDWGADVDRDDRARTATGLSELHDIAKQLGQHFSALSREDQEVFSAIGTSEWSFAWQARSSQEGKELIMAARSMRDAKRDFSEHLGLMVPTDRVRDLEGLALLALLVPRVGRFDLGFSLEADAPRVLDAFEASLASLEQYQAILAGLSTKYDDNRIAGAPIDGWAAAWAKANSTMWPIGSLRRRRCAASITAYFALPQRAKPAQDLSILRDLAALLRKIAITSAELSSSMCWRGIDSDVAVCREAIALGRKLREAALRLADHPEKWPEQRAAIRSTFVDNRDLLEPGGPCANSALIYLKALAELRRASSAFLSTTESLRRDDWTLDDLEAQAAAVVERQARLPQWCAWVEIRKAAEERGLSCLIRALEARQLHPDQASDVLQTAYCRWLAPRLIDQRPELRRFSAIRQENLISAFRELDKEVAECTVAYIRATRSAEIPGLSDVNAPAGYGVLRRELQKKMRHKAVRELVHDMGHALLTLTPCLMMSPLSVAQFLSTESPLFDLVVFDEASQITVWDAIGTIARGKHVVIVGDPKQMPPTNFFDKSAANDDDADNADDLESILDEALSSGMLWHRLTGHYRSRHESLIAFSNHAYYDNQLVTYPSAETRSSTVSLRRVGGVYGKGSARTNPIEARAVVSEVLRRVRDPALSRLSLGIVTLNAEQQSLIDDLLDQERRADPELEKFFGEHVAEPIFIKNLETVQGDQRDVILLSIGYGPTAHEAKTMSMNFGPLNRKGGERRLNVAITRATTEVMVFASFDPGMIDLTRTSARAVQDLKHYLDFADRGPVALAEAIQSVGGEDQYDSDFELAVAEGLRKLGWTVHTQIGVSKFRIDLGVVHPGKPGVYLAGIECDGAAYHASPTARDRDRVRHLILERLGWTLLRIWSTEYFRSPVAVLSKTHEALLALVAKAAEQDQASQSANVDEVYDEQTEPNPEPVEVEEESTATDGVAEIESSMPEPPETKTALLAQSTTAPVVSSIPVEAQRFYEAAYEPVIAQMTAALIDTQGPMTFKLLSDQIARAHGFQRTGSDIKKRIWALACRARRYTSTPDGHKTFWPSNAEPQEAIPFRGLTLNAVSRAWVDVPYAERVGLAKEVIAENSNDPVARFAERIGIARLTAKARAELDELLTVATKVAKP